LYSRSGRLRQLNLAAEAVAYARLHAQMLGQAMIQRDQLELLLAAVAGAGLGGVAGIVLGHEELGTLIWALVGAAVVSGVVYFYWSFRRH
jgi:hypothetical protein